MLRYIDQKIETTLGKLLLRWFAWLPPKIIIYIGMRLSLNTISDEVTAYIVQVLGEALAIFGAVALLIWLGYFFWKLTPTQRFRGMVHLLERIASRDPKSFLDLDFQGDVYIRAACKKLDKLKIPHPGWNNPPPDWQSFAKVLIAEAEEGTIEEARKAYGDMKVL